MCGVTGLLDVGGRSTAEELTETVRRMADTLHHRGPDDGGAWIDAANGLALGHRRLSIIDLSEQGHQPMISASGRYVLTYNGEIYNFREIRSQLDAAGHTLRGKSDTEAMLGAIERWGLDKALTMFNGMFAFALWDREHEDLHLARDRLGEKPMYYGWIRDTFLFGSELKALRAHPRFSPAVDRGALALYLRHNCVPAPYSIFTGIAKLPPGTRVRISRRNGGQLPLPEPYWSLRDVVGDGLASPWSASPGEVGDELERLLSDAVGIRMHADVPLGAFLSGGIDSSLIVALMQARSTRPVKTFAVGFENAAYDESADAARVARHLGTDHVELRVTGDSALEVIPLLPELYDEPFADCSQIPTFLVSRLAREEVTVALSGDGGDELFGGYNRYTWCQPIWNRMRRLPRPVRASCAALLTTVPPKAWESLFRRASPALPPWLRVRMPATKVQKLAEVLPANGIEDMYRLLSSHWKDPATTVLGGHEPHSLLVDRDGWPAVNDPAEQMMYLDTMTYLPDDILVKLDRASMGVSLEARVPFLDHRVVEFAWKVPLSMKMRGQEGKTILRHILSRHVPPALVSRPKMGFGLPIDDWLRGPLRDWAEGLLEESRLRSEGFFDVVSVRKRWQQHLAGGRNWQYHIWDVLMFQAWIDSGGTNGASASTSSAA